MSFEKLSNIGFKKVGEWTLAENKLYPNLVYEENSANILYCFVIENEPVYIGKTTRPLKKRMYGYQRPGPTQFTNIRNNKNILDMIAKGLKVEIFVLPDHGLLKLGDFHLSLAAGLEDSITNILKPKWNMFQAATSQAKLAQPLKQTLCS